MGDFHYLDWLIAVALAVFRLMLVSLIITVPLVVWKLIDLFW